MFDRIRRYRAEDEAREELLERQLHSSQTKEQITADIMRYLEQLAPLADKHSARKRYKLAYQLWLLEETNAPFAVWLRNWPLGRQAGTFR